MSETTEVARPPLTQSDLIGNRRTYTEIAAALGRTERWVYKFVDQLRVPYVRVASVRYVDPADIHAALIRDQANAEPRRSRGRPRKTQ